MEKPGRKREYDLEDRTYEFSRAVRAFVRTLPRSVANADGRQVIRASGSVGANYIEANEALSKRDFVMRIKISRKEVKECRYWLRLLDIDSKPELEQERSRLIRESSELIKTFSAILQKC